MGRMPSDATLGEPRFRGVVTALAWLADTALQARGAARAGGGGLPHTPAHTPGTTPAGLDK